MFCPKCGGSLTDDAQFCGNCGSKLEKPDKPDKPDKSEKIVEDGNPHQGNSSVNAVNSKSSLLMSKEKVAGISAAIFVIVMIVAGASSGGFGLSHDSASSVSISKDNGYSYSSSNSGSKSNSDSSSSERNYRNINDLQDAIRRGEVDI